MDILDIRQDSLVSDSVHKVSKIKCHGNTRQYTYVISIMSNCGPVFQQSKTICIVDNADTVISIIFLPTL
jgi:hypothetical protein